MKGMHVNLHIPGRHLADRFQLKARERPQVKAGLATLSPPPTGAQGLHKHEGYRQLPSCMHSPLSDLNCFSTIHRLMNLTLATPALFQAGLPSLM